MALTRRQLEIIHLGGTVSFPSVFPHLGSIKIAKRGARRTLRIDEAHQGSRIVRTILLKDVSAVFIPFDPKEVDLNIGTWFFRDAETRRGAITRSNVKKADQNLTTREVKIITGKLGIVYVREDVQVLIEASVGAAESENFVTSMMKYMGCL